MTRSKTVACGAGFAGDRIEPAVLAAVSGQVDAIALECLAERTLVPGLRARRENSDAGADPRLKRRLGPLLQPAFAHNTRIISNLGAANPAAAAHQLAKLAQDLDCTGLKVAGVTGDDVLALADHVAWNVPVDFGDLLGAHAYLGCAPIVEAIDAGADVVVTGRVADSALFSAEVVSILEDQQDALAGATTVGHLLECSGHITGGNYEHPHRQPLSASDLARLGFPLARVHGDGSAEIHLLEHAPGIIDVFNCALQLLYEVHDPAAYITPDVIIDFTAVRLEQVGPNRVRVSGARSKGRPQTLKVSGFIERPGFIADVEIGFAGRGCLDRAKLAVDVLRERLHYLPSEDVRIDVVGLNSVLGDISSPAYNALPEARTHISVRCSDLEMAQTIEDEVFGLTLSGPSAGGSLRSERRPRLEVVDGLIERDLVKTELVWGNGG
jgi:hypothetical protein